MLSSGLPQRGWCECTLRCAARSLGASASFFASQDGINKRMWALCCNARRRRWMRHDPQKAWSGNTLWMMNISRARGYLYERAPARSPRPTTADHIEGGTCFEFQWGAALRIHYRARQGIYVYDADDDVGGGHFERRKSGPRFRLSKNREIEFGTAWELMTQPPAFKTPPVSTRTFHALSSRRFSARQARQRKVSLKTRDPGEKILRLSMGEVKMVKCVVLRVTNAFDTRLNILEC